MNDYVIFTDAASDLPINLINDYEISVIPMRFEIGGDSYRHYPDDRELGYFNFYEMLRGGYVAKTSQIASLDFVEYFTPALKYGLDILYIAFSSGLSGTYQSSVIAAEELKEKFPERKIYCVDSRCASAGQGMLVYHAAIKKRKGFNIEALKDWVVQHRDHMCHWFTANDLIYLKRGGRLSASVAIFGTMLSVKPILHVNAEGRLALSGKVRDRLKSLVALVDQMEKSCVKTKRQTIFIGHGDCIKDAVMLAEMLKKRLAVTDITICNMGPITVSHAGPDLIGLYFFGSEK